MIDFFYHFNPLIQTIIMSCITFLMGILGSAIVFVFKRVNKNLIDSLLGISSGIMLSAAIFSLLIPAIEQAKVLKMNLYLTIGLGIILGCLFLILGDYIASKSRKFKDSDHNIMFIISIILHNIPEGAAIGVAFASVGLEGLNGLMAATMLSLGIGIQNIPESSAVSITLKNRGINSKRAFLIGALSGIVEPIAAILGVFLILSIKPLLPILLSFASGAMLFVVIEELIPESQTNENKTLITFLTLLGFILMMFLEFFFA